MTSSDRRRSRAVRPALALLIASALTVLPYGVVRAASVRVRDATARICEVASDCPTIEATAKPTVSERDVARFLDELWDVNFEGGPLGPYQLQRCANPGPAPYHVQCVLFSTGTPGDLAALKSFFDSSRLFTSVAVSD